MNKAQFISFLASKTGYTYNYAEKILNATLDSVEDALFRDHKVIMRGFGTFDVRKIPERQGRNPRTGEPMRLEAYNAVRFRPAAAIKDYLD